MANVEILEAHFFIYSLYNDERRWWRRQKQSLVRVSGEWILQRTSNVNMLEEINHSANVLHRDLKLDNLLVKEDQDLKIADFSYMW